MEQLFEFKVVMSKDAEEYSIKTTIEGDVTSDQLKVIVQSILTGATDLIKMIED